MTEPAEGNGFRPEIRLGALQPARSPRAYELHLCALEHQMAGSIAIRSPEDIQSKVHWSDRMEPFAHQVRNLITFCRRAPVALIADDVGLGKTISAGLILSELRTRKKVKRALVLCPKLLGPQWKEELEGKFAISAVVAVGADLTRELRSTSQVVITTYDSARNRLAEIQAGTFDMLILDEAHKLRNLYGGASSPLFASRVREALENRSFKYVVMLTATPIQNRLWDLYSLIDCLSVAKGHENPLGSESNFEQRFLADGRTGCQLYPGRVEEFRRILSDYMVRTNRRDSDLVFPAREVRTIACAPGPVERRMQELVAQTIQSLNALAQSSLAIASMSSPRALAAQMANMAANGTLPESVAREAQAISVSSGGGGCKLERFEAILAEVQKARPHDWRVVIFTTRKETQKLICERLASYGIAHGTIGGGQAHRNQKTIEEFRKEPPEIHVVVSTDAGAEGVNLQSGNFLINYDLPWNPMVVEQRIGRVQRLGSKHATVTVCNLVVRESVEELIVARLMEKMQAVLASIGDVEAILEAADMGDGETLEAEIRRLVVSSLKGQDVTMATERIRRSMDEAKRIFEEEKELVERNLGALDAMHHKGPSFPALTPVSPRMPSRTFVLSTIEEDGGRAEELSTGHYWVVVPGRAKFLLTFDENDPRLEESGLLGTSRLQLFAEGKPEFERLVGSWSRSDSHHVEDLRSVDAKVLREEVAEWTRASLSFPHTVGKVEAQAGRPEFVGTIDMRASTAIAFDRYEKLVRLSFGDSSRLTSQAGDYAKDRKAKLVDDGTLHRWISGAMPEISQRLERDSDLAAFRGFYDARYSEELPRARGSEELERKLKTQFTADSAAEIIGATGAIVAPAELNVEIRLEDAASYPLRLSCIPGTAQIGASESFETCALTKHLYPQSWLETCAFSKERALRHRLIASQSSGRFALPEYVIPCAVSGRQLLRDEIGVSEVSGLQVDPALLRRSDVSGKAGLETELVRCQITESWALPSELVASQVSGKLVRTDEVERSVVSGTLAHRSELRQCSLTQQWLLATEGATSSMSGAFARESLFEHSAKHPERRGLPAEMVICALTGKKLIEDETVVSAVSGKCCDKELAAHSEKSNAIALPSELIVCEESGKKLLPSELERCAYTHRFVDSALLVPSEASGRRGLSKQMQRCPDTGCSALPDEFGLCEESQVAVLKQALEKCSVTGKNVRKKLLARSDVSGVWFLRQLARTSEASGRTLSPEEVVRCIWSNRWLAQDEVAPCATTGLLFDRGLLSSERQLGAFEHLKSLLSLQGDPIAAAREQHRWAAKGRANDVSHAAEDQAWVIEALRANGEKPKRIISARCPSGEVLAVVGESSRFLGFGRKQFGAVLQREKRSLVGHIGKIE